MLFGIVEARSKAMARLSARTQKNLQHCILEIYSDLNADTFHENMVEAIAKLIPALSIGYAEVNPEKTELSKNIIRPVPLLTPDQVAAFEANLADHPLMHIIYPGYAAGRPVNPSVDRDAYTGKALKIHDVLTKAQFRRLGLYNEFYRNLGIEYQMLIFLYCGRTMNRNLAINRDRRDFTEEERLVLNLLGPHLIQAYKNAEAHTAVRKAIAVPEEQARPLRSFGLTQREEDVLSWVAQGKTNEETAKILKIAPGTVKVHLERIYQKLGVENRTAAAALARDGGTMGHRA